MFFTTNNISILENKLLINKTKVAIIIPGKKILLKKMGKIIDDYNEVIRFNSAPTKGFESYVGSKTTLRIINNVIFSQSDENREHNKNDFTYSDKKILVITPKIFTESEKLNLINKETEYFFYNRVHHQEIFNFFLKQRLFPISAINHFYNLFFYKKFLSIGFFSINFLINIGCKLTIFGLDLDENMEERSNYSKAWKIGKSHNLQLERSTLKKMYKKKLFEII